MATTLTLADLILQTRQRADMVQSQFVTDAELTGYINESYAELYDLLVEKYGNDYFVNSYQFTTDGSSQFALPADLYKLLGVDVQCGMKWESLHAFNFSDRNSPHSMRYRILGSSLMLSPQAPAGRTLQVWYVPRPVALVAATDTIDQISGWGEYVVTDAAIKCLAKEESDCSVLMAQKQALILRIQSAAENRDAGQPATVTDNCQKHWSFWGSPWGFE